MKAKGIRIFSIVLGSLGMAYGLIGLFVISVEQIVFTSIFRNIYEPGLEPVLESFLFPFFRYMMIFQPFIVLIGLGYLLFGIRYFSIGSGRHTISLILCIASLVWYTVFATGLILLMQRFIMEMTGDFFESPGAVYIILASSFAFGYAYYGVPQLLISSWVKKDVAREESQQHGIEV